MPNSKTQPKKADIIAKVAERIRTSDNVLVALSKDPSVDELSAALGLTFILDKIGKHATAIFSGAIPNAIEFLEPEKTFEANTDSLQDFIIALDKEKADHLRYKIEGDYVKVFITPYKTTIDESDMEFSHGDYNVDLVISLDVATADDLDGALAEYGRIMHDATSINISADDAGKFGDLEWADPKASSVSEMVGLLVDEIKDEDSVLDESIATALLAGIVAATNRFSNERTTPDTMALAAKLMSAGADQQLISSSIPVEILTKDVVDANEDLAAVVEDEEELKEDDVESSTPKKKQHKDELAIEHEATKKTPTPKAAPSKPTTPKDVAPKNTTSKPSTYVATSAATKPVAPLAKVKAGVRPAKKPPVVPTTRTPLVNGAVDFSKTEPARHGEVEFDPDEDLPPAERAAKEAKKAEARARQEAEAAEQLRKRAPIEAAIAEINARNNPNANVQKSPMISQNRTVGSAAPDPIPNPGEMARAASTPSIATLDNREKEAILDAGLNAVNKQNGIIANSGIAQLKEATDPKRTIQPIGQSAPLSTPASSTMSAAPVQAPAMPAPVAPVAPVAPLTPPVAPVESMAAAAPVAPLAPSAPLASPAAPVMPTPSASTLVSAPLAPEPPVMPAVPEIQAPLASVAPTAPVAPLAPVAPTAPVAPLAPPKAPLAANGASILPPAPSPFSPGSIDGLMPPTAPLAAAPQTPAPSFGDKLMPAPAPGVDSRSALSSMTNAGAPSVNAPASDSMAYVTASMQLPTSNNETNTTMPAPATAPVADNKTHYLLSSAPVAPNPSAPTPAAPVQNSAPTDPGAFHIPGM